jgi:hypothetical protein
MLHLIRCKIIRKYDEAINALSVSADNSEATYKVHIIPSLHFPLYLEKNQISEVNFLSQCQRNKLQSELPFSS